MRHVLEVLDKKTNELAGEPFFEFVRDTTIPAERRMSYVPALAHFVMSFADLYTLIFREEPARDKFQELVNAHTYEDGGHWKWFLADLPKLGHDPKVAYTDAVRFIWSDATVHMRLLSYGLCQLAHGADSLRKLVLVMSIEAAGKVSLKNVAVVGKELAEATGKTLVYFGPHHFETESDHTLEDQQHQRMLAEIELEASLTEELVSLVDRSFVLFTNFIRELMAFTQSGARLE